METSETKTSVVDNVDNYVETSSKPPRTKRLWRWLLLTLLLVGGGFGLWRVLTPATEPPAANAEQPQGVKVKLAPVQTATISDSSDYIADLDSRRSVTLQPRIEGQVSRIFVRSGTDVPAGTPIIQVDPREQQASVNSVSAAAGAAEADLENAKSTLKSLEADRQANISDLKFNQQQYQSYSRLATEGAVSRQTGNDYTNRVQAARASLSSINQRIQAQRAAVARAEKAVLQAQANTREQQVQLQYFKITAPFAGTVGDFPVKVGDFVNTSTQLTTITQNRPLEVKISVPIELAPQLRQGMPVEIMDAQARVVGTSRIFFISPSVTTNTQSVLVKSLFENSEGQLRADQFARARVIWDRSPGVLIPTTAVTRLGGEAFVYVAEQQQPQPQQGQAPTQSQPAKPLLVARQKPVKLGVIQGNNYQVLEGLKPGERLIVSGILNLKDGAPIDPES